MIQLANNELGHYILLLFYTIRILTKYARLGHHMSCYSEQFTDDIETIFTGDAGIGWEFEYLQLSPGNLGSQTSIVNLPEISIHWYNSAASVHIRECHQHDSVFLAFVISSSGAPKWYGRDFRKDNVLLYFPEHEQDYVIPTDTRSLGLTLGGKLLQSMNWKLQSESVRQIDQASLDAIASYCSKITAQVRHQSSLDHEEALLLQERLVIQLDTLLMPWLSTKDDSQQAQLSASRSYKVVRCAETHMAEWKTDQLLDISLLAKLSHVSPRTLYRSYRNIYGMGPYEYHVLKKLRSFRENIRQQGHELDAITRAAYNAGFSHMSRFSEMYRKRYDELPSKTLLRWNPR
jgi:AraC-like DNA-binding protein